MPLGLSLRSELDTPPAKTDIRNSSAWHDEPLVRLNAVLSAKVALPSVDFLETSSHESAIGV